MKRRHAAEEDSGPIGIHIFLHPLRPCSQNSPIRYWPFDLIILGGSFIKRATSVPSSNNKQINLLHDFELKHLVSAQVTYRTFILKVFIHQMYVLKTRQSTFFQLTPCLSIDSGMIILFKMLCMFGSSEFDSTRNGAQQNSTVALQSYGKKKKKTSEQ